MKKFIAIVIMSVLCMTTSGCGKNNVNVDIKALGNNLNTDISYTDALGEVDLETASRLMNLSGIGIADSSIYVGAGATAEEIIVLECNSEDDAVKAGEKMRERVSEQKEVFADYAPLEVPKLDNAYIYVEGKYAVMCVSADSDKADEIVKEAFSK